jgi:hypothetical protein
MPSLREKITVKPIHSRFLDLKTYPLEEDRTIVEGWLKDERFKRGYALDKQVRKEGLVHHMAVRLLVGGIPPTILDAEAEMLHVPHEQCHTTLDSIKKVIGLEIKSGFGDVVHKMIGGVEGCAHLAHLVMVMGQEAVHGYWTHKLASQPPDPRPFEEIEALSYVVNSCSLWREDGPLHREIKASLSTSANTMRKK